MLLLLFLFGCTAASSLREFTDRGSCDSESIPYKLTVSGRGNPDLYCASPSCLGDDYSKSDRRGPSQAHNKDFTVTCEGYKETVCNGPIQWTGGFMEYSNGTHVTLKTKCCTYRGLKHATPVRTIILNYNDEFSGGTVTREDGTGAFDLIKEVKKKVERGDVKYEITVVRIPCEVPGEEPEEGLPPFLSRNKRRLGYHSDKDTYYGFPARYGRRPAFARGGPIHRPRAYGLRRRPAFRRLMEDYYYDDYDTEYYAPRKRYELVKPRTRVRTGNVLWPIAYESPKVKQFGAENTMEGVEPVYTGVDELQVVENTGSEPDMVVVQSPTGPRTSGSKMIVQTYVTDNAYSKSETGPIPPPNPAMVSQQQSYIPMAAPAPADTYVAPQAPQVPSAGNNDAYQIPQVAPNNYIAPPAENAYVQVPMPQPPQPEPVQQQQVYMPAYQPSYQPAYQPAAQPAAQPAYAPSYPSYPSGGLNNMFGNMQCFSGKTTVETDKGAKTMEELEVGDLVMTIDESFVNFSPVVMFLHHLEDEEAEFLKITAENHSLELTPNHLIYISNCGPENAKIIAAKEVELGNCVHVIEDNRGLIPKKITSVDRVQGRGIYAPLTTTGDIIVNGMLASCHSNLGVKVLQQSFFNTYKGISSFFKTYMYTDAFSYGKDLPTGVSYLTSVLDLFVPHSYF